MSDIAPTSRRAARAALGGSSAEPVDDGAFRVLFVCSGNICRSPLAEQVLRARVRAIFGGDAAQADAVVRFSSAGTIAAEGQRMPEQAAELSVRYGGDPSEHEARYLTPAIIQGTDLVLTMAREHRSLVVRALPRANRFTFTLREFAALFEHLVEVTGDEKHISCDGDVSAQLRALVPLIAAQRGVTLPPAHEDDYDVVDPYRRSQDTYDASGEQAGGAIESVLSSVRAVTRTDAPRPRD
ncbi:protein-tyrosine phosphatase [Clavibacter sp. B3I6]|uniref:arsenate reductase/protein-tyrosine-phosphatase family protein n=1 Tax=Clavibacter sp. B3I6 TaxID=3042268 RepID=UPI0027881B08|nr:low molecular weight phosphatase family protein [Clavibacter sp. B3I6]MDQ0744087.1 protein-tyrosine phosphatase [Clavibacter sp. B3I6]